MSMVRENSNNAPFDTSIVFVSAFGCVGSTACPYPGTTIGGTISLVKFYYSIGETVTFDCSLGLVLNGAKLLRCQKNGKWSAAIPTCINAGN